MIKLSDFIKKWNGKKLEYDGLYLFQCVDLVKAWNHDLGYPPKSGNGKDWINNAGKEYTKVLYKKGLVPREGAIYSFKATPGNPGGHTGVFISGNTIKFKSFDQNFPIGSPCHIQEHDYSLMLGWIQPKNYQGGDDVYTDTSGVFKDKNGKPLTQSAKGWFNSTINYRKKWVDSQAEIAKLKEQLATK